MQQSAIIISDIYDPETMHSKKGSQCHLILFAEHVKAYNMQKNGNYILGRHKRFMNLNDRVKVGPWTAIHNSNGKAHLV